MNESLSKTTASIDKAQLAARISKNATQLLEDYVLWHQSGWSDEEFGQLLGISAKTVKNRYLADARKQGLIEAGKRGQASPVYARDRAFPVENSTPIQPTPNTIQHDHHLDPAPAPQQRCVQAEADAEATADSGSTVVFPEVVDMSGEQDFQRAMQLFAELDSLAARNFASGWTELQWNTLGGECRTFAECCDARGKRQRSRPERKVFAFSAN